MNAERKARLVGIINIATQLKKTLDEGLKKEAQDIYDEMEVLERETTEEEDHDFDTIGEVLGYLEGASDDFGNAIDNLDTVLTFDDEPIDDEEDEDDEDAEDAVDFDNEVSAAADESYGERAEDILG